MNIRNIAVKLNDLGGIVNFETDNGAFDTVFVLRKDRRLHHRLGWQEYRSITFGSGVDDARLNDAEIDAVVDAIEQALSECNQTKIGMELNHLFFRRQQ